MTNPPISEVFKAGTLFDYAAWNNDSVITMANVPWNSTYEDVIRPDLAEDRANAFIDAQASTNVKLDKMIHARFDRPIRIQVPFNVANQYNYIRVSNPVQHQLNPDIQKDYFYFIMSVGFVNPDVTELTVELDGWTTFGKHFRVTQAYLETGHMGIANTKAFDNYGRDYLTVPEGREIGGEYLVRDRERVTVMTNSAGSEALEDFVEGGMPYSAPGYDVLIATTVDFDSDPGTVDAPKLVTARGGLIQGLYSGAKFYVFDGMVAFSNWLAKHRETPWVTQGVISITLIPRVDRYLPSFNYNKTDPEDPGMTGAPPFAYPTIAHQLKPNWREELRQTLPPEYRHLDKLLTFPYTAVELTTWGATPVILKPEMWADKNATVTESACIIPPSQRVVFSPQRYNAIPGSEIDAKKNWIPAALYPISPYELGPGDDGGEYLDLTTMIANFPTMPVVNDSAIAYLANNKNQIAYGIGSADWAQTRAGAGVSANTENMRAGINATRAGGDVSRNLASSLTNNSINAANDQMVAGAVSGIAQGVAGGAVGGPAGMGIGAGMATLGAIGSAVSTGINNESMSRANRLSNSAGREGQEIGIGATQAINANNGRLARYAAAGDHANTIAGINAKTQDARLTQPTTVGQMGGEAFNLVFNNVELAMRIKMIDNAAIRSIGDYWLQYGYAVQAWTSVPTDLRCMDKFTYWKMAAVYLETANFPEFFKQLIRGVLMNGVKVWDKPSDIGRVRISDNNPLPNITIGYNV